MSVDYAHTRQGAAAAAANDDQAAWTAATDPAQLHVIGAFAAPSGRTALKAKACQGIGGLLRVLHGRKRPS